MLCRFFVSQCWQAIRRDGSGCQQRPLSLRPFCIFCLRNIVLGKACGFCQLHETSFWKSSKHLIHFRTSSFMSVLFMISQPSGPFINSSMCTVTVTVLSKSDSYFCLTITFAYNNSPFQTLQIFRNISHGGNLSIPIQLNPKYIF